MRIYISVLTIITILILPLRGEVSDIEGILSDAFKGGIYIPPTDEELKDAETLLGSLFRGVLNERVEALSRKIGLRPIQISHDGERLIILMEDERKTGRGLMIFRLEDYRGFVIQVPHSFTDIHTRKIGLRLFLDSRAEAVIFNTVRRQYSDSGTTVDADMAHIRESYFTVFAKTFAETHPSGYIIQLHGFSRAKRKTPSGRESDVIISSGRSTASSITTTIYRCLKNSMGERVNLYPYDVRELGGRKNSIAGILNEMGFNGFVHIEMSRAIRDRLVNDRSLYRGFEGCLIQ
jgi:hypothetical protein